MGAAERVRRLRQQRDRRPAPEMQRLSKALVGDYDVVETHHARPGRPPRP